MVYILLPFLFNWKDYLPPPLTRERGQHWKKIPKIVQEKLPPKLCIFFPWVRNSIPKVRNSFPKVRNSFPKVRIFFPKVRNFFSESSEFFSESSVAIFLARFSEFSSDVLFYSVSSLSSEGGGRIIFSIEQKWQQDINQE